MNLWHDIPLGDEEEFNVVVEIPKLSRIKYELEKETGLIQVDRVLYSPMHYPANYGFVPQTLWDDGDPLDVLVISHEPFVPGALVKARAIGIMDMTDDGKSDAKVLAVPVADPRFNGLRDLPNTEPHILEEISHFFKVYKDLQKKEVKIGKWGDKKEAQKALRHSIKLYQNKYPQS
ncbi:MAG: inorganic diphosphatase [Candidatus Paceibacterota bacterium]